MDRVLGPVPPPNMASRRLEEAQNTVSRARQALQDKWKECREGKYFKASVHDTVQFTSRLAKDTSEAVTAAYGPEFVPEHTTKYLEEHPEPTPSLEEMLRTRGRIVMDEAMLKLLVAHALKHSSHVANKPAYGNEDFEEAVYRLRLQNPLESCKTIVDSRELPIVQLVENVDALRLAALDLANKKREAVSINA